MLIVLRDKEERPVANPDFVLPCLEGQPTDALERLQVVLSGLFANI
jgi:hypothetical protein